MQIDKFYQESRGRLKPNRCNSLHIEVTLNNYMSIFVALPGKNIPTIAIKDKSIHKKTFRLY